MLHQRRTRPRVWSAKRRVQAGPSQAFSLEKFSVQTGRASASPTGNSSASGLRQRRSVRNWNGAGPLGSAPIRPNPRCGRANGSAARVRRAPRSSRGRPLCRRTKPLNHSRRRRAPDPGPPGVEFARQGVRPRVSDHDVGRRPGLWIELGEDHRAVTADPFEGRQGAHLIPRFSSPLARLPCIERRKGYVTESPATPSESDGSPNWQVLSWRVLGAGLTILNRRRSVTLLPPKAQLLAEKPVRFPIGA